MQYLTAIWEGKKKQFAGVVQSKMQEAKEAANVAK
jgi:hypothetical protein